MNCMEMAMDSNDDDQLEELSEKEDMLMESCSMSSPMMFAAP